jgi:hypothetical protein
MSAASAPAGGTIPGRVVVTARAFERVFAALAADELGGGTRGTRVRVSDANGLLAADIEGPVDASGAGSSVLGRVESARGRIASDGAALTGATLSRVSVRVTDIVDVPQRRTS